MLIDIFMYGFMFVAYGHPQQFFLSLGNWNDGFFANVERRSATNTTKAKVIDIAAWTKESWYEFLGSPQKLLKNRQAHW